MENSNNIAIISGLFAISGIIVGYFIGAKKYAFEKLYEQRLMCIKDLYKQVVILEFILKKYINFIGAETTKESINKKIESLNEVKKSFQKFQHKFWQEEIILDESTADQINIFLSKYIEITSKLVVSNISQQQGAYKEQFDYWDESYKLASSDLVKIKDDLKAEFKKTLKIKSWRKILNKSLGL